MQTYANWGEKGVHVNMNVDIQIFERLIQTFKKKNDYRNGQELWLKVETDQEQHENTII